MATSRGSVLTPSRNVLPTLFGIVGVEHARFEQAPEATSETLGLSAEGSSRLDTFFLTNTQLRRIPCRFQEKNSKILTIRFRVVSSPQESRKYSHEATTRAINPQEGVFKCRRRDGGDVCPGRSCPLSRRPSGLAGGEGHLRTWMQYLGLGISPPAAGDQL
jgi:hypothetical protein